MVCFDFMNVLNDGEEFQFCYEISLRRGVILACI